MVRSSKTIRYAAVQLDRGEAGLEGYDPGTDGVEVRMLKDGSVLVVIEKITKGKALKLNIP